VSGPEETGEATLREEAQRNLRRNYAVHLLHGMLGQTGFRLIQAPTFIPAYVFLLSGSDLVVGIARASQAFGQFLTPIVSANLVEHRRRVLPLGFLVGGGMRLQILGIALAGFFLSTQANVIAVCVFLGLFGFFLGMQGVIFNLLISKVIPIERRGLLQGVRNALASVTVAAVGGVGGVMIARDALGNGYAATFLLAFVLTALGLACLAFMREPESPSVRRNTPLGRRLGELPALLRDDPAYTHFIVARSLGVMGRMAVPFYVLLAGSRIDLSGEQLGLLTAAFGLAQGMVNVIFGAIADRRGFRAGLLCALATWMVASLILLGAGSFAAVLAGFVGLGAGLGGFMMTSQNLVLEFGSRANLPMRIAVANSTSELVGVLGPILGGALAAAFSYPLVIIVALVLKATAFGVTLRLVEDPRHRPERPR
jgi:MFS family permease